MFSIWINGILSSLGILSAYYRIFDLSMGPTYIHLKKISKVLIILILLCLWGKWTKTNQKDFFK